MAARKTVKVSDLIDNVNAMIAGSKQYDPDNKEIRKGMAAALERVLFDTENYKGFRYNPEELNGEGRLKENYDDTNRRYHKA